MERICEDLGFVCSLDPKPMPGDWNAHCNYIDVIKKAVEELAKHHDRHIRLYDPTLVRSGCGLWV